MLRLKTIINLFVLLAILPTGLLFAQYVPPGESDIDLEIDSITPNFIMDFKDDYISFEPKRLLKWMTPERGLVEDGILMTYEFASTKFKEVEKEMSDIKPDMMFLRGYYNGLADTKQFYKAFYQLNFKMGKVDQKINMIAVFEKIDGNWYLVQTHSLKLTRDTIRSSPENALALQTNILAIGDYPFDYEGKTYSLTQPPRRFASEMAKNRQRPVLLNFFTRIAGDFGAQLDWAESFYPKIRGKNIYFFCVTDDEISFLEPYLKDTNLKIIPNNNVILLDEDSLIHHDLEIDIHPYIMLVDHRGIVRGISRGYNKESLELVERITFDIIDEANRDIALEKEGGRPIHKY